MATDFMLTILDCYSLFPKNVFCILQWEPDSTAGAQQLQCDPFPLQWEPRDCYSLFSKNVFCILQWEPDITMEPSSYSGSPPLPVTVGTQRLS